MNTLAAPPPPRMSWEEFLQWADEDTYAEWMDGEIQPMTAPGIRHQLLLAFLLVLLRTWAEKHQSSEILAAPYLVKLRRSGRLPDLLFVASEHQDRLGETYLDGPPDLAVEIISPESRTRDRRDKLREYEAGGVRE